MYYVYEEAIARYHQHSDGEVEAALDRVIEKHHHRIVNEVVGLLHEELMDARLDADPELSELVSEMAARKAAQ